MYYQKKRPASSTEEAGLMFQTRFLPNTLFGVSLRQPGCHNHMDDRRSLGFASATFAAFAFIGVGC